MKNQIDLSANILFSIVEYRFMNRTTIRLKFLFILFWDLVCGYKLYGIGVHLIKWSVGHIWKRTKWLIRLDCFVNNRILYFVWLIKVFGNYTSVSLYFKSSCIISTTEDLILLIQMHHVFNQSYISREILRFLLE